MDEKERSEINVKNEEVVADSAQTETSEKSSHAPQTAEVENPRKKSHVWIDIFCVIAIALSLFLMYQLSRTASGGDEKSFAEVMRNLNVKYLLLAIVTLLGAIFLDSMKYFVIMKATTSKARYPVALKAGLLGKYYDAITPFASGGQPMQIYYLHRKGLSGGESSGVIFIKFAYNISMWLTICCCLMAFNRGALDTYVADWVQRQVFVVGGWIGFAINCFLPLLILSFVVFPKMTGALVRGVLNIGSKLKIVKDKEATLEKAKRIVNEFISAFVSMVRKPLYSFVLILLCIGETLLTMTLPYLVVLAMAGNSVTPSFDLMLAIMTLNVYVSMSVTIIPTPGNSGAMENAFMLTLTSVAEGILFWTVFSWRFLSYYSYILIGLVMTIVQMIKINKRNRGNRAKAK